MHLISGGSAEEGRPRCRYVVFVFLRRRVFFTSLRVFCAATYLHSLRTCTAVQCYFLVRRVPCVTRSSEETKGYHQERSEGVLICLLLLVCEC